MIARLRFFWYFGQVIDKPLTFVDVETTGTNAISGRIIEIGIVKVEGDKVVNEYQRLINPELRIDPFIEQMTGITFDELERAPTFYTIKDEIYEILDGSIFVAHNVRFDYSFIRNEFKRVGINFTVRHFDTVKLARILYPGHSHYNLDAISERHGIVNTGRHRAFGDAKVLWDFFRQSKENIKNDLFDEALKLVLKKPSIPSSLTQADIDKLPEAPGVYILYGAPEISGEINVPLYVGKSINIKDRVLSHFSNDYNSSTDLKIVQTVKSIESIETAGDFSALLLESSLIKKLQPIYNRMLRQSRKMIVIIKITNENGYNTIIQKNMEDVETHEIDRILGVFKNQKQMKDSLYEICKEYSLCTKVMGLEKGKGRCFYFQLGTCNGACIKDENFLKYNMRFDEAFFNKKIKTWKFEKPILIKEVGEKSEIHLVDKWCYIGSIRDESEDFSKIKLEYRFDYDTYKILKRYLNNPNNLKNIALYNSKKVRNEAEMW